VEDVQFADNRVMNKVNHVVDVQEYSRQSLFLINFYNDKN
jgi:hypothetical protein